MGHRAVRMHTLEPSDVLHFNCAGMNSSLSLLLYNTQTLRHQSGVEGTVSKRKRLRRVFSLILKGYAMTNHLPHWVKSCFISGDAFIVRVRMYLLSHRCGHRIDQ